VKQVLKKKWVVPVGALVLTLAIGSAAFAATGTTSDSTSTSDTNAAVSSDQSDATENQQQPQRFGDGGQRSDETALTGDTQTKAQDAALAEVGSDATVIRAETDADGNASYEVHMQKSDGTMVTVYLDESFNVVKTEEGPAGGHGGDRVRDRDSDGSGAPSNDTSTEPASTTIG